MNLEFLRYLNYENLARDADSNIMPTDLEDAEVSMAKILTSKSYICRALSKSNALSRLGMNHQTPFEDDIKHLFNITKIEQKFDHLLKHKWLKLLEGHKIPSLKELK